MSTLVTLLADGLVAVLLVATIVSSLRLSRRIAQMKADEAAFRRTIGDLMAASATAERAIAGLRSAIDECDRTLAERLEAAGRGAAEIAAQVAAGEGVISRIGAIVGEARGAGRPAAAAALATSAPGQPPAIRPEPASEAVEGLHSERLGAAAAAALAMTERALQRVRSRAA
ncbi:hypothetical protein BHAOGJBA_1393 [Methylobacterium hispanicum]|jgi:hypothetical protein|uniref:DUF6468 domain-containing protein n=1 Tax=Methylobacterium hispanicum TaxID=270350 RepID=A0AAV4ZI84_9HYPH|nr:MULTISPECIES: DUF6468 domain-containing protein [Methylobacterium]GJD87887.1 hypothetical protein BHAOGJBA_1393 [Methylobacterium hispanicum]